jgi:O-antigen/teichoic acid export membrane protein
MTRLQRNILANFAGKGLSVLAFLVFVPLYIRFLGIEAYGLIGIFASLQAIFGLLDLGLSATLNRELARHSALADQQSEVRHLVRSTEVVYWAIALVAGCLVVLLSRFFAYHWIQSQTLDSAAIRHAFVLMGLALTLQLPLALYSGGLIGLQRQVLWNLISAGSAAVRGIATVMVLWLVSPTVVTFFVCQIVVTASQTLLTALFLWSSLPKTIDPPRFRRDSLVKVWRFAAGMSLISVTTLLLTQLDKVILSRLLPLESFGYYTLAGLVASSLYYFTGSVFEATFPLFSELVAQKESERLRQVYHRSSQFLSVGLLPAASYWCCLHRRSSGYGRETARRSRTRNNSCDC